MGPLISVAVLLIHVIFGAYIIILLVRLLLQKLGANWHNPISQFVIQLTEKPLKPFRKVIPGLAGFDLAIVLFVIILQCVEIILLCLLQFGAMPNVAGLLISSIAEIFSKLVYIYIYAIVINAVASWFSQAQGHPILQIIYLIVNPVLSRFQRIIPLIGGIDVSPIAALLAFTILNMLIVQPLLMVGSKVILG